MTANGEVIARPKPSPEWSRDRHCLPARTTPATLLYSHTPHLDGCPPRAAQQPVSVKAAHQYGDRWRLFDLLEAKESLSSAAQGVSQRQPAGAGPPRHLAAGQPRSQPVTASPVYVAAEEVAAAARHFDQVIMLAERSATRDRV